MRFETGEEFPAGFFMSIVIKGCHACNFIARVLLLYTSLKNHGAAQPFITIDEEAETQARPAVHLRGERSVRCGLSRAERSAMEAEAASPHRFDVGWFVHRKHCVRLVPAGRYFLPYKRGLQPEPVRQRKKRKNSLEGGSIFILFLGEGVDTEVVSYFIKISPELCQRPVVKLFFAAFKKHDV